MPLKKRFAPPQWVPVGLAPTTSQTGQGGEKYKTGTPAYQEGGWSPLWALAGQGATSMGKDVMCQAAKRFRQSFCQGEDEAAPPKKKRRKQRGTGGPIYEAGTDPYQEGGVFPWVVQGLLPHLLPSKQKGGGSHQMGGFLDMFLNPLASLLGGTSSSQTSSSRRRQRGGAVNKKRKKKTYITGSSVLHPELTFKRLFRRLGGRPIGVLPDNIPGPQLGMGRRRPRPTQGHCFQGLP